MLQGTDMNSGEPKYSSKREGSMRQQSVKSKELQKVFWQSDYLIVLTKQGNACGGKGVAATP